MLLLVGDTTTFSMKDPYCELEAVRIIEEDILKDPMNTL